MILPSTEEKLAPWARNIIERCRSSQGSRAGLARSQKQWLYTGSPDGNAAIYNKLYPHIDRLASSLYSPNDLRFHMDFTHSYPKQILQQAEVASRVLTRTFEQRDIDIQWGQGVQIALTFGAAIPKLLDTHGGMTAKICMPWQIGVYREDREGFADQEAVCETNFITPFELWRRISHLPDAIQLYRRALSYAKRTTAGDDSDTYFHQLLLGGSPPAVQTDPPFMMQPGGLVQVMADSIGAQVAPDVVEELITIHELWVVDDERQDWTTIQICEPDILIAPR